MVGFSTSRVGGYRGLAREDKFVILHDELRFMVSLVLMCITLVFLE